MFTNVIFLCFTPQRREVYPEADVQVRVPELQRVRPTLLQVPQTMSRLVNSKGRNVNISDNMLVTERIYRAVLFRFQV